MENSFLSELIRTLILIAYLAVMNTPAAIYFVKGFEAKTDDQLKKSDRMAIFSLIWWFIFLAVIPAIINIIKGA